MSASSRFFGVRMGVHGAAWVLVAVALIHYSGPVDAQSSAGTQSGAFTVLPGGEGFAAAINNAGQVAGTIFDDDDPGTLATARPIRWTNGVLKELATPAAATYRNATDISDDGRTCGQFVMNGTQYQGVAWDAAGNLIPLAGARLTWGINSQGLVIGVSTPPEAPEPAPVLWSSDGVAHPLPQVAVDISEGGHVLLVSPLRVWKDASADHAVQSGELTTLAAPPGAPPLFQFSGKVNRHGQVAVETDSGLARCFLGSDTNGDGTIAGAEYQEITHPVGHSHVRALSDGGHVILSAIVDGVSKHFLWKDGIHQDLTAGLTPGVVGLGGVSGVNEHGVYCGRMILASKGRDVPFVSASNAATLKGKVEFEKLRISSRGLERKKPEIRPARRIRVEIVADPGDEVIGSGFTDDAGEYQIGITRLGKMKVRALAEHADAVGTAKVVGVELTPLDGVTYSVVGKPFKLKAGGEAKPLLAKEKNGGSGPLNILDVVHQVNQRLASVDAAVHLPNLTVRWAVDEATGTNFETALNTINLNGSRNIDSDEFDDTVIGHEYGHFVLAIHGRDDTIAGPHPIGAILDPRNAFSEGWATFFGNAFRETPGALYQDTSGRNGSLLSQRSLEVDIHVNDNPGYISEHSVSSLIWDVFDSASDDESLSLGHGPVWLAAKGLKNERFVYLIDYCEVLHRANPSVAAHLPEMLLTRSVQDYTPGADPPVPFPFPRQVSIGQIKDGAVDSLNDGTPRNNLASSSHFYELRLTSSGTLSLGLNISANATPPADLDLFLLDRNGDELVSSKKNNGPGDSEFIQGIVPRGTFFIEVRSWSGSQANLTANAAVYQLAVVFVP